ncbi:Ctp Synthase 2 [Manis pentadactyla]|nr:Ctp Synthase 2 [Manis pentadactyla]
MRNFMVTYLLLKKDTDIGMRPMKPSPPYLGLLLAATGKLNAYLQRGRKLSKSDSYSDSSDDSMSEPRTAEVEIS